MYNLYGRYIEKKYLTCPKEQVSLPYPSSNEPLSKLFSAFDLG